MWSFSKARCKALHAKIAKTHQARLDGDDTAGPKELDALLKLAKFYDKNLRSKKFPDAELLALECYRGAAMLGHSDSQYIFADRLVKRANFWMDLSKGELRSQMHETYAKNYYEEAFSYMRQAEQQGHPLAKRLHGLTLMHGWGVPVNTQEGTRLIIESIKEEGTMDKANQIFEKLGLHSPDVFAALMTHTSPGR